MSGGVRALAAMSRTLSLPMMVLAALTLLIGGNSSASLISPDAEFSFAAPVVDAKEATDAIRAAVAPLGFKVTRQPRVRADGFFRAEFKRPPNTGVSLSGRVSCIHVGIYTSLSPEPKTTEATRLEATQIYNHLLASLKAANPTVLFFKSSGGSGGCEEAL